MLDRAKVLIAFHRALSQLKDGACDEAGEGARGRGIRPRTVALLAHKIYCSDLDPTKRRPAPETFRKFSTGQLAFPEVVAFLQNAGVQTTQRVRLDRQKLRSVFTEAIQRLETRFLKGQARPLQVVRRAYELYTRDADQEGTRPSHRTFEDLIYGKSADPEILNLIETALRKRTDPS